MKRIGLVVGLALIVMGCSETSSDKVPCEEDAECVDSCTAVCDRRGEELLSYRCGPNRVCQCSCSSSGTGGTGGEGGTGGSGGTGGMGGMQP